MHVSCRDCVGRGVHSMLCVIQHFITSRPCRGHAAANSSLSFLHLSPLYCQIFVKRIRTDILGKPHIYVSLVLSSCVRCKATFSLYLFALAYVTLPMNCFCLAKFHRPPRARLLAKEHFGTFNSSFGLLQTEQVSFFLKTEFIPLLMEFRLLKCC
jgi:hypothetical protein